MLAMAQRMTVGPISLTGHQLEDVLDAIVAAANEPEMNRPLCVVTPNIAHLHYAARNTRVAAAFDSAQVSLPDGWPIAWALRWRYNYGRARVTGSDLSPRSWNWRSARDCRFAFWAVPTLRWKPLIR